MKRPQPKVLDSVYVVKINGTTLHTATTLREARHLVKQIHLKEDIKEIQIVRKTLTETIINNYKCDYKKILTIDDFFES